MLAAFGMQTFRDLHAWQEAMRLSEECYAITRSFPRSELYGLAAQIRRASVSVPSNLAEGYCRRTTKAYRSHVSIALGSHGELSTLFELAERLAYLNSAQRRDLDARNELVGRLLFALYRALTDRIHHRTA
jgi:four helix bundle protein